MNIIDKPDFYKNMIISGANNLYNFYPQIDKLNIFPVPDGDTGTNLNLTVSSAASALNNLSENYSFKDIVDLFSYNLIMNARGNSGVIFSQIFKGVSNAFSKTIKKIDFKIITNMFQEGKKTAYKAVMKPVEGTILTVIKDISIFLSNYDKSLEQNKKESIEFIFSKIIEEGNESLKRTTELLPALKEVGVVDSGAFGLMKFLEGMDYFIKNKKILKKNKKNHSINIGPNLQIEAKTEFGYCTEAIVMNNDAMNLNIDNIRKGLKEQEKNNSIIAVADKDIIKVHVHTLNPGNVLIYLQQFGSFKKIKIDNMSEQVHQNVILKKENNKIYDNNSTEILSFAPTTKIGKFLNKSANIKNIIYSKDNKNISTQEFLNAIKEVPAKNVVILPNDSNMILSAQSAIKLLDTNQNVNVMSTKNIQEGILVSRLYDLNESFKKNMSFLKSVINDSISIAIYKSENNGKNNSITVKKNDFVALHGKKIIATNNKLIDLLMKSLELKINKYSESVTLILGNDITKSHQNLLTKYLDENFDVEYEFIDGELEKYSCLLLIE